MKKVSIIVLALIFGFSLLISCGPGEEAKTEEKAAAGGKAKTTFVTIGTGGITGVYYPTGGAIARIMNKKKDQYGIRATVESTGGSVFNVNAVMAGDLEFGVVQSDRQFQAINGMAEWKDKGKQEDLRAIFTIHPESITLVAAVDAGIENIEGLKGKRVNIGNPGSGQRQNSIDALTATGIDYKTDITRTSRRQYQGSDRRCQKSAHCPDYRRGYR
jgi:TRAP transporter TAXI family solute receptor